MPMGDIQILAITKYHIMTLVEDGHYGMYTGIRVSFNYDSNGELFNIVYNCHSSERTHFAQKYVTAYFPIFQKDKRGSIKIGMILPANESISSVLEAFL